MDEQADDREHELDIEYEPLNRPTVFRGVCSCGWESHWVTAAGMVHAAHAAHAASGAPPDDAPSGRATRHEGRGRR